MSAVGVLRRLLAALLHAVAVFAYAVGGIAVIAVTPLFVLAQEAWRAGDAVAGSTERNPFRSTSKEG